MRALVLFGIFCAGSTWAESAHAACTGNYSSGWTCALKSEAVAKINEATAGEACAGLNPGATPPFAFNVWTSALVVNDSAQAASRSAGCLDNYVNGTQVHLTAQWVDDDPEEPPEGDCETGGDMFVGSYASESMNVCDDGCEYSCGDAGGQPCSSLQIGSGPWRTTGTWSQTGQTCGTDEGEQQPPPTGCTAFGSSGFTKCASDPIACVRSPTGALLCPNTPGPHCDTAASGAACANQEPPDGYDPPGDGDHYLHCQGGQCTRVDVSPPDEADDDEDDEEEDPEDEEDDCPEDDPDCEDEEPDEAGDSPCASLTPPACSGDVIDCAADIKLWHIKCESEHSNKLLEEFKEQQVKEARETNAKLKALKEMQEERLNGIKVGIKDVEKSLERVQGEVKSGAKSIVDEGKKTTTAVDGVAGKVDGVKTELKGLADVLKGAASASSGCGTAPACSADPVSCAQLHQQWLAMCREPAEGPGECAPGDENCDGQPDWTVVQEGDAGEGVTQADSDATTIQSEELGVGDIDQDGFLGGGSCPSFPQMSVGGQAWSLDDDYWCQFLTMVRAVMMLLGAWWSASILLDK